MISSKIKTILGKSDKGLFLYNSRPVKQANGNLFMNSEKGNFLKLDASIMKTLENNVLYEVEIELKVLDKITTPKEK